MVKKMRFVAIGLLLLASCKSKVGDQLGIVSGETASFDLPAPSNFSAVALNGGPDIQLSWTDNATGETGYRIDVDDDPTFVSALHVIEIPADSMSYVYRASFGRTLYFRVLAVTAAYQSLPTGTAVVATRPSAPAGLQGATFSTTQINLTWLPVPNVTGYRIERSQDGGITWAIVTDVGGAPASYSDVGLAPGTEYGHRLRALNAVGASDPSSVVYTSTQSAITIVTASSAGFVGSNSSIGVTPSGVEHISHYNETTGKCVYTTNQTGSYVTVTADSGPLFNSAIGLTGTALALDAAGKAHVAAQDFNNYDLRYATNTSGSFVATTLDSVGFVGGRPKLKVSPSDGSIQIVYEADGGLKRAVFSGGSWTFEAIPVTGYLGAPSFALDASGDPHVAFIRLASDGFSFELAYARKAGGVWSVEPVTATNRPSDDCIAVDPSGVPHMAYYESITADLMHAARTGGSWTTEAIDATPGVGVGLYCSMAIDGTAIVGRIHVAYYNGTTQDLKYARKDPGGAWVRRTLDQNGMVGTHTSTAVDGSGAVHISYYDDTNDDLKVASGMP